METKFWHQSRAIIPLKNNEKWFVIVLTYILSIPMHSQNFFKIHQLLHKILSINEISTPIKDHNLLKMNEKKCSIIQIYIWSISMHIRNLIEIHKLIHKILSINKILTSIKGHNSVKNWPKITCIRYNIDLVFINASICSEDIEEKHIFTSIKSHNSYV